MTQLKRATPFKPVPAEKAALGYNMQSRFTQPAWMTFAAAGGATIVRTQPSWNTVENYNTGVLALSAATETGLAQCVTLGLQPMFVAGYGPPVVLSGTLTVSADTASGSTVIPVTGNLGIVTLGRSHVVRNNSTQIVPTGKWSYNGAYIHDKNTVSSTITLSAATNVALTNGELLKIQTIRYPSLTGVEVDDAVSMAAFFRYAKFLAERIAAYGLTGTVNIWNEAPWRNDAWNNREQWYDGTVIPSDHEDSQGAEFDPNASLTAGDRLAGMLNAALLITDLPDNVRFVNGASDKTGASGILTNPAITTPTATQIAKSVCYEGIHPYGKRPEVYAWDNGNRASATQYAALNTTLDSGSNFRTLQGTDDAFIVANGTGPEILATELGIQTADDARMTMYLLRRVASLWGVGIPAVVYSLGEGNVNISVAVQASMTARPAYTALARLSGMVAAVGRVGTAQGALTLPTLIAQPTDIDESTIYIPMVVSIYGSTGSVLFVWQRTWNNLTQQWDPVPGIATVDLKFHVPAGVTLQQAIDVGSGSTLTTSQAGDVLTVPANDGVAGLRFA